MRETEAKPLLVLPLLRDNFTIKNYEGLVTVAMVLICAPAWIAFISLLHNYHWTVTFLSNLLSAIVIAYTFQRLRPDWAWEKDFIGTCQLFTDKIEIVTTANSHKYTLQKPSLIRITSNYYRGGGKGRRTHNGIVIIEIDQTIIKTVLTSEEGFYALQAVLKEWYKSGVKVVEKYCEEDYGALLLEPYGKYADIQRIKRELGIS